MLTHNAGERPVCHWPASRAAAHDIDPAAATQVENVAAMISTLINGMSVALNTTLVGAVLYIWLIVNYRILTTGTVDLLPATMEMGEVRAGG